MMGMGMRSIWISLRAMNYTDRAFKAAIGNLDKLTKKEKAHLKTALQMSDAARMNIASGLLYGAMLGMAAGALATLIMTTQVGAQYMDEFGQALDDVKVSLADTFFEVLKPALDVIKVFLDLMKQNAPLRYAVVILTLMAGALMGTYVAYTLISGIRKYIIAQMTIENFIRSKGVLLKFKDAMANITLAASNHVLATSLIGVGAGMAVAFGLFFALKDVLGPLPAAIIAVSVAIGIMAAVMWSLAAALTIVTVGIAAGLGAAAFTAAVAQSSTAVKGFETGTSGLPYTGLFVGHKGEVIYNPATARPTGIGVELGQAGPEGGRGATYNDITIDFSGSTIHTKADKEELLPWMKRALREELMSKE